MVVHIGEKCERAVRKMPNETKLERVPKETLALERLSTRFVSCIAFDFESCRRQPTVHTVVQYNARNPIYPFLGLVGIQPHSRGARLQRLSNINIVIPGRPSRSDASKQPFRSNIDTDNVLIMCTVSTYCGARREPVSWFTDLR